ncbi:uncharacterized protein LAESUDRAFT_764713 [Laetiporus sulphureus 93-53]|nr:uncharacterized protein LAESUDRAFT_764713 [Laetiporus sulphureus 93-53]KZT00290.1 hypothetical protein LAESUDRAFT_764713 [Laetiporus sulphureus 93-53]
MGADASEEVERVVKEEEEMRGVGGDAGREVEEGTAAQGVKASMRAWAERALYSPSYDL